MNRLPRMSGSLWDWNSHVMTQGMTPSIIQLTVLQECRDELSLVLQKLDEIGAGVAAIHVDAAVAQLNGNVAALFEQNSEDFDPSLISICVGSSSEH